MKRTKILGGGVRNLLVLTLAIVIALSSVCMVSATDTITITKKWDDGLTGVDAANRDAPKVVVTATMSRSEMLDLFYPVGTCYVTVDNSFNPNEAWGGTWVKLSEGQNVIQAGSTFKFGTTGGEATHTLTVNEMPSHRHPASQSYDTNGWQSFSGGFLRFNTPATSGGTGWSDNAYPTLIGLTGGSQAHNNMPPYVAGNIWKRTA